MNTSLTINNSEINFTTQNGIVYVAVKPICQALGIDASSQIRDLKSDPILASVVVELTTTGSDGKRYKMVCLPSKYIFGWIFHIDSGKVKPENREALIKYQMLCYDVLYDFFNSATAKRVEALKVKTQAQIEIEQLETKISQSDDAKRLHELRLQASNARKILTKLDNDVVYTQRSLWDAELQPDITN